MRDREIRALLVDRLRDHVLTRRELVRVSVERGEVTLSGEVPSSAARRAADDEAWNTPGVVNVHNHVRIMIVPVRGEGPRAA
jgi:osmotically-inducible protein OsmY